MSTRALRSGRTSREAWRFWVPALIFFLASLLVDQTFPTDHAVWKWWIGPALVAALANYWSNGFRWLRRGSAARAKTFAGKTGPATRSATGKQRWTRRIWIAAIIVAAFRMGVWIIRWRGERYADIDGLPWFIDVTAHLSLLSCLTMWTLAPRRGHTAILPMSLIMAMAVITAGGISPTVASQISSGTILAVLFAGMAAWVVQPPIASDAVFNDDAVVSSGSEASTIHDRKNGKRVSAGQQNDLLTFSGPSASPRSSRSWSDAFAIPFCVIAIMVGTSLIGRGSHRYVPMIRDQLWATMTKEFASLHPQMRLGLGQFVSGGQIGSIRRELMDTPDAEALRAECDVPPGYLRGSVFHRYRGGTWTKAAPRGRRDQVDRIILPSDPDSPPPAEFVLQRRPVPSVDVRLISMAGRGTRVFSPAASLRVIANADQLRVDADGLIRSGDIDTTRPYTIAAAAGQDGAVGETATVPPWQSAYLEVPSRLVGSLDRYLQSITLRPGDEVDRASQLEDHFRSTYEYSLTGHPETAGRDPLAVFFEQRHPAHCEFFASATCLLLRRMGIPSRYVTGYVMLSKTSDDEYWVARNRDAHAWVEAFDRKTGEWFVVESTPGRRHHSLSELEDAAMEISDSAAMSPLAGGDADGLYATLRRWWAMLQLDDLFRTWFGVLQYPLLIGLVGYLYLRRHHGDRRGTSSHVRLAHRLLRRAERKISRRTGMTRSPDQTLHAFADDIQQRFAPENDSSGAGSGEPAAVTSTGLAQWLRSYADWRYAEDSPAASEGNRRSEQLRRLQRELGTL